MANCLNPRPPTNFSDEPILSLVFFLLFIASGLGGKARSALIVVTLFAFVITCLSSTLQNRNFAVLAGISLIWISAGYYDLIARSGTAKATFNDRIEEPVNYIKRDLDGQCGILITHDIGLTFAARTAEIPKLIIYSRYDNSYYKRLSRSSILGCKSARVYVVESYIAALQGSRAELQEELARVTGGSSILERANFSPDPDAAIKRKFPIEGGRELPDYRFIVRRYSYPLDTIAPILRSMRLFKQV